jgi:cytochrome c biogenesis protein CcmG/thiol:disulfide interchange protein DsbE
VTPPRPGAGSIVAAVALLAAATISCADATANRLGGTVPAIVVADASVIPDTVDELPPIDPAGFDALREDVRGTPLVVNVWASWCEPCERELPLLADAARAHRDEIQFLGVDILDTPDPARSFLERFGVPYPNMFDATGAVRDALGSIGQPVTVFYAADGALLEKVDGELSPRVLAENLAALTR